MTGLDWLPERARVPIAVAAAATERALADQLIAVCLVGPAARRGRDLRGAHAELLIVADSLGADTLGELGSGLTEPRRSGLQIRTVTRSSPCAGASRPRSVWGPDE